MILEGRVTVNGARIETLGLKIDPLRDHIKVDGKLITRPEPPVVLLLNKPRKYVSTVKDPQGRPTVMDLVKGVKQRVYPVGRLDYDAEGLLILTNDGALAQILSHPRYSVLRTYLVKLRGVLDPKSLNRLKRGVRLEDGPARAVFIDVITEREKNSWVRIGVTEGRNHLVKRMFLAIGHPVLKLKRIAFGPMHVEGLSPGEFRYLSEEEIDRLRKTSSPRQASKQTSPPKSSRFSVGSLRTKG